MKIGFTVLLCFKFAICFATNPIGYWEGHFEVSGQKIPIAVNLKGGKTLSGTIDIPMQGVRDLPLADIEHDGTEIQFAMTKVPGNPVFEGDLNEAGDAISGNFIQAGMSIPFSLKRFAKPSTAFANKATFPIDPIPGKGLAGVWRGIIETGPMKLHLELLVKTSEDGSLHAKLNSVDQNAVIPVSDISETEGQMMFQMSQIGASFKGKLSPEGRAAEGTWEQAGQTMALTFFRVK